MDSVGKSSSSASLTNFSEAMREDLRLENAPPENWQELATEIYRLGGIDDSLSILREASSLQSQDNIGRISVLNSMGTLYSIKSRSNHDSDKDGQRAMHCYNRASRIDTKQPSTWSLKAQLMLSKGEFDQAVSMSNISLKLNPDHVLAHLVKGCALFNLAKYQESYSMFAKALRLNPCSPPFVRLGLGFCFYKLGKLDMAEKAFKRVLQLDPENVEALVALGCMEMEAATESHATVSLKDGMEKILKAYNIYPYSSMALSNLAEHFFYKGQYAIVERLSEVAMSSTQNPMIRAHSCYNLARAYHNSGDMAKAKELYLQTIKEVPPRGIKDFLMAYHGLGQIHLYEGNMDEAIGCFAKILESEPNNALAMRSIGYAYASKGDIEKAVEQLEKSAVYEPLSSDDYLHIGELRAPVPNGHQEAADAFEKARELLGNNAKKIPPTIGNNIGAMQMARGEYEKAKETLLEALGTSGIWTDIVNGSFSVDYKVLRHGGEEIFNALEHQCQNMDMGYDKVTLLFNLARSCEQSHESIKAMTLYWLIVYKFPAYHDAYLRLAVMLSNVNDFDKANELVHRVLREDNSSVSALTVLGNMELKAGNMTEARDAFKDIRDGSEGKDSYSSIALANWNYNAGLNYLNKDKKKKDLLFQDANYLYNKVLSQNPSSIYAANGIAILTAEKGNIDAAKDIFASVQEGAMGSTAYNRNKEPVSGCMPSVWVNLAHIHQAQGNYKAAVGLYQNCLHRFYNGTDVYILQCIAKTHYEAKEYLRSKRTLQKAIRLDPANHILVYDLGITMTKHVCDILNREKNNVSGIDKGMAELATAKGVFEGLKRNCHRNGFSEEGIGTHVEYCDKLSETAQAYRAEAQRNEEAKRIKQDAYQKGLIAKAAKEKLEEEKRRLEDRRRKKEEEAKVMSQEEKLKKLIEAWNKERDDAEGGGDQSNKKRKRGDDNGHLKKKKSKRTDQNSHDQQMDYVGGGMSDNGDHDEGVHSEEDFVDGPYQKVAMDERYQSD